MSIEVYDVNRQKIRAAVNGYYDIQKIRISTGNRVVQSFYKQLGLEPGTKLDDMPEASTKALDAIKHEYYRISDSCVQNEKTVSATIKQLAKDPQPLFFIKNKMDYELISSYIYLLDSEQNALSVVETCVKEHPLWDAFFKDVKGCGPLMSAMCIAYLDPVKARHVSSFWRYAGLDVVTVQDDDGTMKQVGRRRWHTEKTTYIDKNGETKEKNGLTYNPFLKTKIMGVLASGFLKAGLRREKTSDGKVVVGGVVTADGYAAAYLDYITRMVNNPALDGLTPAHRHWRAMRYMAKQFLRDLWVVWRQLSGLEVSDSYEVAFLGRKPHKWNEYQHSVATQD